MTLAYLEAMLPVPEGLAPLDANLLLANGEAVLVTDLAPVEPLDARRLRGLGFALVDQPFPLLDRESLEVVTSARGLDFDPEALAELERRFPMRQGEVPPPVGRYPVRALVVLGAEADGGKLKSPSWRTASLATVSASPSGPLLAADLEALYRLGKRTAIIRALGHEEGELPEILRNLPNAR